MKDYLWPTEWQWEYIWDYMRKHSYGLVSGNQTSAGAIQKNPFVDFSLSWKMTWAVRWCWEAGGLGIPFQMRTIVIPKEEPASMTGEEEDMLRHRLDGLGYAVSMGDAPPLPASEVTLAERLREYGYARLDSDDEDACWMLTDAGHRVVENIPAQEILDIQAGRVQILVLGIEQ